MLEQNWRLEKIDDNVVKIGRSTLYCEYIESR